MKIHYTQLRHDLDEWLSEECDTYRYDIHPVTGRITLTMLEQIGAAQHVKVVESGVITFRVERPR